jgi:hypothetical protein
MCCGRFRERNIFFIQTTQKKKHPVGLLFTTTRFFSSNRKSVSCYIFLMLSLTLDLHITSGLILFMIRAKYI